MYLIQLFYCILNLGNIDAAFYKTSDGKRSVTDKDILHKTTAPSLITCALKCRIIDKESIAVFDKEHCSCVKKASGDNDNSKDLTLAGTFLQLKTLEIKNRCHNRKRIIIKSRQSTIKKGNLQVTVPKLTKEFVLSFDIKPTEYRNGVYSVLHMTTGKSKHAHGARIPAVFLSMSSLWIYTDLNENNNWKITLADATYLNQWSTIRVSQMVDATGKWIYNVQVNGTTRYTITNKNPSDFFQVKCYLANTWNAPQPGYIRNVWLDVKCED